MLSKKLVAGDEKIQESSATDSNVDMRKPSCADEDLKIDLPIVDASKIDPYTESPNPPIFDPDVPCCSHQMFPLASASTSSAVGALTFPTKLKKFPRKVTSPANAAPSMLLNQPALSLHAKKTAGALKLRNAFASASANTSSNSIGGGGVASVGGPPSLMRAARRSSLSKDGRKLKKKKSLKADATLKRKKSRVF